MKPYEITYRVRSYETGVANRVTLPTLCNYLQEAAGDHAIELGFGILELQTRGLSWMIARLHLKLARDVPWGGDVRLVTWPSGLDAQGAEFGEAVSEWLTVDLAAQRIVRPAEAFQAVVPPNVARVPLAASDGGGKFAALAKVDATARILVRRADHDFNDHVNNVHYVEWALEALPAVFRARSVRELDIVFRQAAHAGDELESRLEVVDADQCRCAIVRPSDGALLATAALAF